MIKPKNLCIEYVESTKEDEDMKPTIPRNIADAIETVRKAGADNANILRMSLDGNYALSLCRQRNDLASFAVNKADVLAAALLNGYQIEMTPEDAAKERVREYYAWAEKSARDRAKLPDYHDQYYYVMAAVKTTLNALGIKIEGVNA